MYRQQHSIDLLSFAYIQIVELEYTQKDSTPLYCHYRLSLSFSRHSYPSLASRSD